MARPLRIQFAGAAYYVTAQGNERREIFRDDEDRRCFLETLGEASGRFGAVVHGYCLMPNHYSLLTQTPRGNLSQAAGWLQSTYAARFNRRHKRSGHLLQGRFKAHLVDADPDQGYARSLIRYVHLSPVRPRDPRKPVPTEKREWFEAYSWSSHRAYAGTAAAGEVPAWQSLEWLNQWRVAAGRPASSKQPRRAYRADLAACFGEPLPDPFAELRGGLVLGGEELWRKVKALLGRSSDPRDQEWAGRDAVDKTRRRVAALAEGEPDKRVKLWMRVSLGGERMTELAREFGYRDGSGILQAVKRLEARALSDKAIGRKLKALRETVAG